MDCHGGAGQNLLAGVYDVDHVIDGDAGLRNVGGQNDLQGQDKR